MRASPDLAPWKFRGNHITDPDPAFFFTLREMLKDLFHCNCRIVKKKNGGPEFK